MHQRSSTTLREIAKYKYQYFMVLPGIAVYAIFCYLPMAGLQIAFKDYRLGASMWTAPWIGLENFGFIYDEQFWNVVKNTFSITITRFALGFPAPIILALLFNEMRNEKFKKTIQSISYIPNFLSWIIVAYMIDAFLSPSDGLVNHIITLFGGQSVFFMGTPSDFVPIVVLSSIWKTIGWNTILYMAALTTIDPQLYEAAQIDGAGKWRQLTRITLPGLVPVITIQLILSIPSLVVAGYDQIYPLINPANMPVSDVIDTYVIRNGLQQGSYGLSTAVGLVSSVLSLFLVLAMNKLSKAIGGEGLW
jgi:ABC-type polysaccharide transport system, permease component